MDVLAPVAKIAQKSIFGGEVDNLKTGWTIVFVLASIGFTKAFGKLLKPALMAVAKEVAN